MSNTLLCLRSYNESLFILMLNSPLGSSDDCWTPYNLTMETHKSKVSLGEPYPPEEEFTLLINCKRNRIPSASYGNLTLESAYMHSENITTSPVRFQSSLSCLISSI